MTALDEDIAYIEDWDDREDRDITIAQEADELARDLRGFVRAAWHILEPDKWVDGKRRSTFRSNWHIDAICDKLESARAGEIRQLAINIPPRCSKSLLVSVFWPVWRWTFEPHLRFLTFSYDQDLSNRDATKSRDVIRSRWFQERWPHVQLKGDVNRVSRYENTLTGHRIAEHVRGGTGEGGDIVVIDDPHEAEKVLSDVERAKVLRWHSNTVASRFNDPSIGVQVLVMQRLHECLPPESRVKTPTGSTRIDSLQRGDVVLTSQGAQKVVAVGSRPHKGEIITVRVFGHSEPFRATGNHRVLTTEGWVAANDLTIGHRLLTPCPAGPETTPAHLEHLWPEQRMLRVYAMQGNFSGRKVIPRAKLESLVAAGMTVSAMADELGFKARGAIHNSLMHHGIGRSAGRNIAAEITADPEFWWAVGLWIAEGSVSKQRGSYCNVRWTVSHLEQRFADRLSSLFERWGTSIVVRPGPSVLQVRCHSTQLGEFLSLFGRGARHKFLPEWAAMLPVDQLKQLLLGYADGDGSISDMNIRPYVRLASSSLDLLEGFQRAIHRLGIVGSVMTGNTEEKIVEIVPGHPVTSRQSWELRFPLQDAPWIAPDRYIGPPIERRKSLLNGDGSIVRKVKSIEREQYDGEVWDIETPSQDFLTGALVAHNSDLTGHILEHEGWEHLCLPARFDPKHPFVWPDDPRTQPGELLWPEHMPEVELDRLQAGMTARDIAGQFQQLPAPLEGDLLKVKDWRYYDRELSFYAERRRFDRDAAMELASAVGTFRFIVHSWDTSLKDRAKSDFVAGTSWGCLQADTFMLRRVNERLGFNATVEEMEKVGLWAREVWPDIPQFIIVETAANGADAILELKRRLTGVVAIVASGTKEMRAEAASPALEGHNCFLPGKALDDGSGYGPTTPTSVQEFVEACARFPMSAHDDDVDSWSQAMNYIRTRGSGRGRTGVPSGTTD